eukprot:m.89112 g.89112  ORF g.89112 m.89112 type:complete len:777 (+) comp21499_c0_seq1:25-2355(+)
MSRVLCSLALPLLVLAVTQQPTGPPVASNRVLLDSELPTVTLTGSWERRTSPKGFFGSDFKLLPKDEQGSAKFTLFSPAQARFAILATWVGGNQHSSNTLVDIKVNGARRALQRLDQTKSADDDMEAFGIEFETLFLVNLDLQDKVEVIFKSDGANGDIVVDTVALEEADLLNENDEITTEPVLPELQTWLIDSEHLENVTTNPRPFWKTVEDWTKEKAVLGVHGNYFYTWKRTRLGSIRFDFQLAGQASYDVYISWPSQLDYATNTGVTMQYFFSSGGFYQKKATLDQTFFPFSDLQLGGADFELVARVNVRDISGDFTVVIHNGFGTSSPANGLVAVDAVAVRGPYPLEVPASTTNTASLFTEPTESTTEREAITTTQQPEESTTTEEPTTTTTGTTVSTTTTTTTMEATTTEELTTTFFNPRGECKNGKNVETDERCECADTQCTHCADTNLAGACYACNSGLYAVSSFCVPECPSGFLAVDTPTKACRPAGFICDAQEDPTCSCDLKRCQQCQLTDPATATWSCLRCNPKGILLNGECVGTFTCKNRKVRDGGQISPAPGSACDCDIKNCFLCIKRPPSSRLGEETCKKCRNGRYLHENECEKNCPAGLSEMGYERGKKFCNVPLVCNNGEPSKEMINGFSSCNCDKDDKACSSCEWFEGRNRVCTVCKNNFLSKGECVAECPTDEEPNMFAYGSKSGVCTTPFTCNARASDTSPSFKCKCKKNCDICSISKDASVCSKCANNKVLTPEGSCDTSCPEGFEADDDNVCQPLE